MLRLSIAVAALACAGEVCGFAPALSPLGHLPTKAQNGLQKSSHAGSASLARPSRCSFSGLRASSAAAPSYPKPTIVEPKEEHTATVIFLHGLGDTGAGWKRLGEEVGLPWVKWVFPTAATKPVSLCFDAGMPAWADISGLNPSELRSDNEGTQESIDYIKSLIQKEIDAGIPSDRILVAGFSQGGNIALGTAMQFDKPLGGAIALSTWYPRGVADAPADVNKNMPILVCHGEADPVAKAEWGRKTFEYLSADLGMPTEGNIYPEMGHEFKPQQVADIKAFCQKTIGNQVITSLPKPLGMVLEEGEDNTVYVASLKEGASAQQSGSIEVGDIVLAINDRIVKTAGFDAVMDSIVAAEGDVTLRMLRPPKDRSVAWSALSEEEQERRLSTGGVIKVCTDRSCMNQGSKATMRWLTELTPETFSVTRCSCTGSCGKGPNVVVGGKGRKEKVRYETNSVGAAVKMLMEEFELQTDPKIVNQLLNPSKNVEFGISDELVRQGLMQTVDVRSSFAGNRF